MDIVERAIEQPEMIETCKQNMEKIPYVFSAEQLASDVLTRYHARKRLSEVTTLFFDLAGTLCDIPISHIWESVNEEGFRSVLDAIGYADKADSAQMGKLTSQFIDQKKQLRAEAKKSLREFYLGTQLDDFFRQASREDTLLADVLEQLDLGEADRLDMFDSVYMRSELDITRPFSGVVKTLKNLSKHYDLYLLSNNASRQLVHGIIEKIGVKGLFKDVFISCDLGHRKPDSRFIEPILKKTGISAAQTAMIGDRLGQDIAMAQKEGMVSIFMSAEEHEDNEGVSIPYDYEVKTLEGLERLLRKK
jgi:FMN phosphatase YigB (HAD superfamily)